VSVLKTYRGVPASEGIGIGSIRVYGYIDILSTIPSDCKAKDKSLEEAKLSRALSKYKDYLASLKRVLPPTDWELLDAYELMADALVNEAVEEVRSRGVCSELAIKAVYEKYSKMFRESGSELIALRESDLKSIASSLVELVSGERAQGATLIPGSVLVADELYPIDALKLARQGINGLVTRRGGVTSHVAVIARNNDIPYLIVPSINLDEILELEGKQAIVDSIEGKLIVNPSNDLIEAYSARLKCYKRLKEKAKRYAFLRATTIDHYSVDVLCNVGNVEEARIASTSGCDGIGLFRVEFLYMGNKPPSSDTLLNVFHRLAELFKDKPVTIRAPDLGADKPVPYIKLEEQNPFLGLRGVRLLLEYRDEILKPFLEAYLSVASRVNNLRLMLPMVSRVREVYEVAEIIERIGERLGVKDPSQRVSLGIMVETPAASMMLDKLAETSYVEFVSIGTNDLTQYVLAVDRTNARLSKFYSEFDPSVLRTIKITVDQAKRYGVEVEVCGEMASKQYAVPILVGLGVDGLSVNPPVVGLIKYTISKLEAKELKNRLVTRLLNLSESEEVLSEVKKYMSEKEIETI